MVTTAFARNGGTPGKKERRPRNGFRTVHSLKGGGAARQVRIEDYAGRPDWSVRVHVSSPNGEPLPSRIYLQASDGGSYFPKQFSRVVSVTEDYISTRRQLFSEYAVGGHLEGWRGSSMSR
ncbi:MAG: hypothetical protein Ct9H300mP15_24440 [Gemmatimonadota bacterium]|nr:MAG: hypothetical protein Ct9H300mP15_24440 [Gemmatimonadota bacterium]